MSRRNDDGLSLGASAVASVSGGGAAGADGGSTACPCGEAGSPTSLHSAQQPLYVLVHDSLLPVRLLKVKEPSLGAQSAP